MKTCIRCQIEKPYSDFFRDNRLKDGHFGRCKQCSKEWGSSREVKARRSEQSGASIRRSKDRLTDNYVVRQICHHSNLTPDDVRKFPELIKAKRAVIITNRTIKDEKRAKNQKHQMPSGESNW